MDLEIATENVAGGLLDLQAGGRLVADIDPWEIAEQHRDALRGPVGRADRRARSSPLDEMWRVEERLGGSTTSASTSARWRCVADEDGQRLRLVPRVVESGYHQDRLFAAHRAVGRREPGPPPARRHPQLRRRAAAPAPARTPPENVVAVRWLDQRFEPTIGVDPAGAARQAAGGRDLPPAARAPLVRCPSATAATCRSRRRWTSYIPDVLAPAPDEQVALDSPTAELFLGLEPITDPGARGGDRARSPSTTTVGQLRSPHP